jgi:uncharacterized protein YkwD
MLERSAAPHRVAALVLAVPMWAGVVAAAHALPDATAAPTGAPSAAPTEVTNATATAAPVPLADLGVFCPRPTGRWWEDHTAHGCVQQLSGRDVTAPLDHRELTWLDLGALPAFATVDLEALTEELTAHEARVAAEAAEREAHEAAVSRPPAPPVPSRRVRQPLPTFEQVEQMMAECGLSFDDDHGPLGEHPCIAAAWARIVADLPVFEAPSGPGFPALRADWHDVMMAAVNGEREAHGVRRVVSCPSLTRTAQAYAEVLRGWGRISHTGPDGSSPFDRAVDGGYSIRIEPRRASC